MGFWYLLCVSVSESEIVRAWVCGGVFGWGGGCWCWGGGVVANLTCLLVVRGSWGCVSGSGGGGHGFVWGAGEGGLRVLCAGGGPTKALGGGGGLGGREMMWVLWWTAISHNWDLAAWSF